MKYMNLNVSALKEAEFMLDSLYAAVGAEKRRFMLDYKGRDGVSRHHEAVSYLPAGGMTDSQIVDAIKENLAQQGYDAKCIVEMSSGAFRCMYITPDCIEETIREMGVTPPADMEAHARIAFGGRFPVNWNELCAYWAKR